MNQAPQKSFGCADSPGDGSPHPDRKSTRLNSTLPLPAALPIAHHRQQLTRPPSRVGAADESSAPKELRLRRLARRRQPAPRSEEHTSELHSPPPRRSSYRPSPTTTDPPAVSSRRRR